MSTQGLMFDQHFFTGRMKFNEGRYFEAQAAFELLLDEATGLDLELLHGLYSLAVGFELLRVRRMMDPAWAELLEAERALARIPLARHMGVDVRRLKDELAGWLEHLGSLGQPGLRPTRPPWMRIEEAP